MRLRPACTLVALVLAACAGDRSHHEVKAPDAEGVAVASLEIAAFAVGSASTCVLRTDGEVWCVGAHVRAHVRSEEGVASEVPWKVEGLPAAAAIAAAGESWCAVAREDGRVWCWGEGGDVLGRRTIERWDFRPMPIDGLVDVTRIFSADGTACAERRNGGVRCWGRGFERGFDIPDSTGAADVAVAPHEICLQPRVGERTCWRGDGDRLERVALLPAGVSQVATDGRRLWYLTGLGRLGVAHEGTEPDEGLEVEIDPRAKLAAGVNWLCASVEGRVSCRGGPREPRSGGTDVFTPTDVPSEPRFEPVPGLVDVVDVQLGPGHGCALTKARRLSCWGAAGLGALGNGASSWVGTPRRVALDDVQRVAIVPGEDALRTCFAAGPRLACTEFEGHRSVLVERELPGGSVTALGTSGDTIWAVIDRRRLVEWSSRDTEPKPVELPSAAREIDIVEIATGFGIDTCLLLADGSVVCLGPRSPDAEEDGRLSDVREVVELRGGNRRLCARSRDGTLRCWASSLERDRLPLRPFIVAEHATSFALGDYTTCAVTRRGVDCESDWATTSLRGATRLVGGEHHMCGLFEGTRLRCVGQDPPLDADLPAEPLEVVIGWTHACARARDGVYCWGDNHLGQLGDGRSLWEPAPVDVTDAFVEAKR